MTKIIITELTMYNVSKFISSFIEHLGCTSDIIIDCEHASRVEAIGVGALLHCADLMKKKYGRKLKLLNLSEYMDKVIKLLEVKKDSFEIIYKE